jgi:hypothetical protein
MNDKDELLKILQNLSTPGGSSSSQPEVSVGKIMAQLQHITGFLKHLEQGVVSMAAEVQRCSLIQQLFANLLISKGLMTAEEFQQLYHDQVYAPMKKTNDEFQAKMQEVVAKQKAIEQPSSPVIVVPETKEKEEGTNSTVILASERFKKQ